MTELQNRLHLVKLIQESLAHADILFCQPSLEVLREHHKDFQKKVVDYVDGKGSQGFALTNSSVSITLLYDGEVHLHGPESIIEGSHVHFDEVETVLAQLRLYSTRIGEINS